MSTPYPESHIWVNVFCRYRNITYICILDSSVEKYVTVLLKKKKKIFVYSRKLNVSCLATPYF